MRRFAENRRVLFVDTVGSRRPRFSASDLGRIAQRLIKGRKPAAEVEPGIWRLSPIGPVPGLSPAKRKILIGSFAKSLSRTVEALSFRSPILWFFNPRASFVLEEQILPPNKGRKPFAVFHIVDDLSVVPGAAKEEIRRGERILAEMADLVFASAPPLFERMREIAPGKTHYLPNVADFGHFNRAAKGGMRAVQDVESIPHPRILFVGNLTPSKLNYPLLEEMARARPNWHWVFVGPIWQGAGAEDLQALRRLANMHFLGAAPYGDLPKYLAGADALIIPYKTDSSTESVCPLKFFEYLATGKPTVSTPLPALNEFGGIVPLANDADSFLVALAQALEESESSESRSRRIELARRHSWDNRMADLEDLLRHKGAEDANDD